MKTKTPLTKILYRTAAIAFMVLGLWLVYRFFLYSLKFDNNSAAETSFTLFVALSYILHGVVSLIISFHLFRLDNIGKTITLVLLISFIVSAFFDFYISFAFVLFLVIIVLIQRKNVPQDQFQM